MAAVRYRSGAMGVIECTTSVYPGLSRKIEIHGDQGTVIMADETFMQVGIRQRAAGGQGYPRRGSRSARAWSAPARPTRARSATSTTASRSGTSSERHRDRLGAGRRRPRGSESRGDHPGALSFVARGKNRPVAVATGGVNNAGPTLRGFARASAGFQKEDGLMKKIAIALLCVLPGHRVGRVRHGRSVERETDPATSQPGDEEGARRRPPGRARRG